MERMPRHIFKRRTKIVLMTFWRLESGCSENILLALVVQNMLCIVIIEYMWLEF